MPPKQRNTPGAYRYASTMFKDRRRGGMPVAGNPDGLLNPHQLRALRELEACGWKLHFVLTSIYQKPEVVIINPGRDMVAVLEHDGEVNMTPDLS